jgi:hypothetical protein
MRPPLTREVEGRKRGLEVVGKDDVGCGSIWIWNPSKKRKCGGGRGEEWLGFQRGGRLVRN